MLPAPQLLYVEQQTPFREKRPPPTALPASTAWLKFDLRPLQPLFAGFHMGDPDKDVKQEKYVLPVLQFDSRRRRQQQGESKVHDGSLAPRTLFHGNKKYASFELRVIHHKVRGCAVGYQVSVCVKVATCGQRFSETRIHRI